MPLRLVHEPGTRHLKPKTKSHHELRAQTSLKEMQSTADQALAVGPRSTLRITPILWARFLNRSLGVSVFAAD